MHCDFCTRIPGQVPKLLKDSSTGSDARVVELGHPVERGVSGTQVQRDEHPIPAADASHYNNNTERCINAKRLSLVVAVSRERLALFTRRTMLARAASGAAAAAAPMRTMAVQQVRTMAITAEAVRIHSHGKAERVMKCVLTQLL